MAPTTTTSDPYLDEKYIQLAKQLAHNEKKTRDKAVRLLKSWIALIPDKVLEVDLMKLWKGLFYCMWMSDKPLVQQELAHSLAGMISQFSSIELSLRFVAAYWRTMIREWHGIDFLRLDKFYFLSRQMISGVFRLILTLNCTSEEKKKFIEIYNKNLLQGPLNTADGKVPKAICYHFCEYYAVIMDEFNVGYDITPIMIEPLLQMACNCENKVVFAKLDENLFSYLADTGRKEGGLDSRLVAKIVWEYASNPQSNIIPPNRKRFYDAVKKMAASLGGLEIILNYTPENPVGQIETSTPSEPRPSDPKKVKVRDEENSEPIASVNRDNQMPPWSHDLEEKQVVLTAEQKKSVRWSDKSRVKVFNRRLPVSRSPSPVVSDQKPEKGLLKPYKKPLIIKDTEENCQKKPKKPRLNFIEEPMKENRTKPGRMKMGNSKSKRPTAADFM